tara:strand:- start:1016 stop:2206 length:1191 start_codon:yes stop_codon:yes gene_type:complete
MAKSSIGGVFATLTLRDAKFRKGMRGAGRSLAKFGKMAMRAGAVATGALAVGLAAGAKQTIALGASLDHLSTQTGIAVAELMRIQQAYKDNGKSADSAGKDINKMQRAIFEASEDPGGSMDYFAQMGLSAEKLMAMNSTEQFFAIGEAIKGIQNPTKQAALAMDVFGRSGGELLTVFKGSDIDDINTSLGSMPEVMQEFSAELERADTLMGRLPNKSAQFFTGFTAGVVSELIPSLDLVNEFDFTELGRGIGEALGDALRHAAFLIAVLMDIPEHGFGGSIDRNSEAFDLMEAEDEAAAEDRKRLAAEEKAYQEARRWEHANAEDFIDSSKAKPAKTSKSRLSVNDAGAGFDSMQRRGLSMSKNPGSIQNKVMKIQEEIRDILKSAETDGTLKWST